MHSQNLKPLKREALVEVKKLRPLFTPLFCFNSHRQCKIPRSALKKDAIIFFDEELASEVPGLDLTINGNNDHEYYNYMTDRHKIFHVTLTN